MSWSGAGWICLLAFLALPNCSFNVGGLAFPTNLNPGDVPHTSAVFCDIEKVLGRHCATAEDLTVGVRLAAAAVALNTGQTSIIGLDESPEARARCGGEPEAVTFQGSFPEGTAVCLNCSVIGPAPATYATPGDACVAKCTDIFSPGAPEVPPDPLVLDFCQQRSRASTNFTPTPPEMCVSGACSDGGSLLPDFADPRRVPAPVVWRDLSGTAVGGAASNDLTRTTPPVTSDYDSGADSEQWITHGDAYVEFSVARNDQAHVLGLAEIPSGCAFPCPDTDPRWQDVGFGIVLVGGQVYVGESGVVIDTFGSYTAGERLRVSVTDNSDGTAAIAYSRVVGPCTPGAPCNVTPFYAHVGAAPYPFRVHARLHEQGATFTDVRLVHIK